MSSLPEETAPYGTGPAAAEAPAPVKRVRTHHLREMKERGEKFTMLTAYEQYAAQTFDEAGIDVLLVGDSASNNVYGNETSLPVTVDELIPLTRAVAAVGAPRAGRRRPAVRLLPGLARAGLPHRRPVHEGGRRALREARGRRRDGAADRAADPRRHPGDGAHRLHPAVRARPRRLPRPGPRRDAARVLADAEAIQDAGAFAVVMEMVPGDVAGEVTRKLRIPTIGIGAGNETATARCWSGRTPSACAPAGWRSSSSSTPTCTAYCSTPPARTPTT